MFYSHEVLTSRKHGVATIWLVATLGSRSQLKKINRKAILDVDVPQACETISNPSAPMALRLQGNLLYGVSRVYSQQCGYVLSDLHSLRDKLRSTALPSKESQLDTEVGRNRSDLLNLPDDPAFLPELDIDLDLSLFDFSLSNSYSCGILSPSAEASIKPGSLFYGQDLRSMIDRPSADTPIPWASGTELDTSSIAGLGYTLPSKPILDESAIIEEPLFELDEDGIITEILTAAERKAYEATDLTELDVPQIGNRSDWNPALVIQPQQNVGEEMGDQPAFIPSDIVPFGGIDEPVPQGSSRSSEQRDILQRRSSQVESSPAQRIEGIPSAAKARQPHAKAHKKLVVDRRTELTNQELSDWNLNYLSNMQEAARSKNQHKSLTIAKKRAAFWVLEQGICETGTGSTPGMPAHPLAVFSGYMLLDALTRQDSSPGGTKRSRSASVEQLKGNEGRRVRAKAGDEGNLGRAENGGFEEFQARDDLMVPEEDILPAEMGRQAESSLPDRSSQMPWNLSASRQGSMRPFGSALQPFSSSIGRPAGAFVPDPPSALGRVGSRLTTPSPLLTKSTHLPRISRVSSFETTSQPGVPVSSQDHEESRAFDDVEMAVRAESETTEFELDSPAALVPSQQAAPTGWLEETLENESRNFLLFLRARVKEKEGNTEENIDLSIADAITLDELLHIPETNRVVVARALLHILALATKDLIRVNQSEPFGDIMLVIKARPDVESRPEREEIQRDQ